MSVKVVDLRDPVSGAFRVNVSRRKTGNEDAHLAALGNPFRVGPGQKAGSASAKFRPWLWEQLHASDSLARRHFDQLVELVEEHKRVELACWCRGAETCHAQVLRKAIEWRRAQSC